MEINSLAIMPRNHGVMYLIFKKYYCRIPFFMLIYFEKGDVNGKKIYRLW